MKFPFITEICTSIIICDLSDIRQSFKYSYQTSQKKTANDTLELIFVRRLLANNNQYLKIMADCTWPTGPLFKDHHPVNSFQELGEVAEIIKKYFEGFHGNKVLPSFPKEM